MVVKTTRVRAKTRLRHFLTVKNVTLITWYISIVNQNQTYMPADQSVPCFYEVLIILPGIIY